MLLLSQSVWAQHIEGIVFEKDKNDKIIPLVGANIFWLHTTDGVTTDAEGKFHIDRKEGLSQLVVSYVGYDSDTIEVSGNKNLQIQLIPHQLNEVVIQGNDESMVHAITKPINQVTLNEKELQKAACCNLSESFETEGSVDVMYRDGVTGAKEIQMLGLSGTYTQMMRENIPTLRGLATSFGLSYVPGTWIESIQISKGAGSVVNGYESMTGQINLEFRKPEEDEPKMFLNLYGNHLGRVEGNMHLSKRFNPKVGSLLLMHGSNVSPKIDFNDDTFLDIPRSTQVNIYNRWETLFSDKFEMQTGFNVLYENRIGGQTNYNPDVSVTLQDAYGVELNTTRIDGFNKMGIIIDPHKSQSIGFIVNGAYHQQTGFYGKRHYSGRQTTFYGNIIPQTQLGNEMHKLKSGLSFLYDDFNETFEGVELKRTEIVPGAFAEYHFNYEDKVSILAGFRTDYHNLFGWQHTPRLHFKYNFTENTVLRISGGRGFRVPNIFAENTNVLVSSRTITIQGKIQPEISWNAGGGLLHNFFIKEKKLMLSAEFYRTQFINQLIVDLDHHTNEAIFYNLNGKSYSNSFQVDASYEIIEGLNVKLSYKLNDVKTTYNGLLLNRLMVPRHNGLFNVGYTTVNEKWLFDFTLHFNGKARLAHNAYTESGQEYSQFSPTFVTLNAQITKKWKKIDWYLGGENLTNYRQKNPIVDAQNPFGPNFDASMIWGPIVGVVVYTGIRLTLN